MKIHIMGASCAGSTTLGKALAGDLRITYFDSDDYFWAPSIVPYTAKSDPAIRNQMLKDDITKHTSFIIGGSLVNWGDDWLEAFDLVVFLYLPPDVRLERLAERELERYGSTIHTDPERAKLYREFMAWAEQYDNPDFTGRNIRVHERWLAKLSCPIIEIRKDTSIWERLAIVKESIKRANI